MFFIETKDTCLTKEINLLRSPRLRPEYYRNYEDLLQDALPISQKPGLVPSFIPTPGNTAQPASQISIKRDRGVGHQLIESCPQQLYLSFAP